MAQDDLTHQTGESWAAAVRAASVFGSREQGNEWLMAQVPALGSERPVDLCDTFEGRALVREALRKIEYGEFP